MIFNIVNGRPKVATINVTTTPGATVTCVNGTVSLSATASSAGAASFVVPKTGTWTVTSTKGSLTKSGTVSVTAVGETKSITLMLEFYLFKDGVQSVGWTLPSGVYVTNGAMTWTGVGSLKAHTTSAVSFDGYSKLNFEYTTEHSSGQSDYGWFRYGDTTSSYLGSAEITYSTSKKTISLDVSSATGSKYAIIHRFGAYDQLKVYNVWLS